MDVGVEEKKCACVELLLDKEEIMLLSCGVVCDCEAWAEWDMGVWEGGWFGEGRGG